MFSRLSYEMMKHCIQERPIQKNNSIIEMGAVKRKPPVSKEIPNNKQIRCSHLNKRDVCGFR
uniref:Uncharacterized protein n=1 Tax=viral metagenome TaxID=1070528 RepID=A0A6C0D7W4_9ZZZZ